MDITDFFGKNKKKKEDDSTTKVKKRHLKLLSVLHREEKLDLLEYTQLMDFMKSGGNLVLFDRFKQIIDQFDENEELMETCYILYKHLYDLVQGGKIIIGSLIKGIINYFQNDLEFTDGQREAIGKICYFLYKPDLSYLGLYGYAGTGKTTLITMLTHYFLKHKYIKSVVFAAPTNKAVNIMKSKFRVHMQALSPNNDKNTTFNDQLDELESKGLKIHFMTIHKLLNYKNEYNAEGERVFVRTKGNSFENIDFIIVDECSMISLDIMTTLVDEVENIKNKYKNEKVVKKLPKVMFVGDPAQLPPVNETVSIIFTKNEKDITFNGYKKTRYNGQSKFTPEVDEMIKKKYETFKSVIINLDSVTLTEVVRNSNNRLVNLCNHLRDWIFAVIEKPMVGQYQGKKVKIYKNDCRNKCDSEWFKICLSYFQVLDRRTSNIILTWTNKQCESYNRVVRKKMFKKENIKTFEIGDLLILKDFYNIKSENKESKRFYTSEQIKITDLDTIVMAMPPFDPVLRSKLKKFNTPAITDHYQKCIVSINKNTVRKYKVWKLTVQRLSEIKIDVIPDSYDIYVIHQKSNDTLEKDKKFASDKIREMRKYLRTLDYNESSSVDKIIIKPLWKEWNERFWEPFASVNYAAAITVHKSQGSSFYDVFVDASDILMNKNYNEAQRCIYTAITRASNEVHILI